MSYCVNCGSEVGKDAKICVDCGYDPNVRGKRIRPDRSSILGYEEIIKGAERASDEPEKVVCGSCFKVFERSVDVCPFCGEKNVRKGLSAPLKSPKKKYAACAAVALLALIIVLSIGLFIGYGL